METDIKGLEPLTVEQCKVVSEAFTQHSAAIKEADRIRREGVRGRFFEKALAAGFGELQADFLWKYVKDHSQELI